MKLLVINGPNLNLLGLREPALYGRSTLADLEALVAREAAQCGVSAECFQSNHEGDLIDRIHAAREGAVDYIIINAGGLTHTSIALRDALAGIAIPFIEVHVSNVYARDSFRAYSYLSGIAQGVITGFGVRGYAMALRFACERLHENASGA